MKTSVRKTTLNDYRNTENITREAFWNLFKPGCDEHFILHNLRNCNSFINELDLIAVRENEIVGHIITTKAKVVDELNIEHEILFVGPLSVSPNLQNNGIGSKLLVESIRLAKELGYMGMILFGNPEYYHRFGFKNAVEFGIKTKDNQNFDPFMALELQNNGFANIKGRFYEDNAFATDPNELIEFEKQFPNKEKMVTETQFKH